ncbi:undecaprenyl/decaprenyl-phosphate alpha-N-acetylglucosaminyl 1-phosphate transferase [Alkalihalobacillus sp. MEB130]|uniref:glycosyltransferase family 4 protein n=1 Tax=Alkalihalobacillus sp. MEB130 TaxID=2976704 RepID=UPI0028DFB8DC|nr:MraY family glycosyltransferase [Alkalihalobacillus sp. MEB130]MDT8858809.1 undecaprenyl/decaprenyl-phosphate alpha-N-acetylglucosaminyl 1-phosphate transferase [Alkalihalobacillus sp. MEB130]
MLALALIICFIVTVLITPLVKRLAIKIGATDKPNHRKVHQKVMARLGGLAIYIGFLIGFVLLQPASEFTLPILIGSFIIIVTGFLDDMIELSAKWKLLGQLLAAGVVIYGGVQVQFINLPFEGQWHLGWFSIPLTLLWIIGVTNAINLIDGLDGLAAGVSSIVLVTISSLAIMQGDLFVASLGIILLGSTLGFLIHNFNPAKIFMGDTGALFLGYMISVISLLGFKNVTMFSLLVPVIILAIPISDTLFAIVRRLVNKQPLSAPDKSHLHHCLLRLGLTHKQTVLAIYAMTAFFGLAAVMFTMSTLWISMIIICIIIIAIQLIVERVGLVSQDYRPMIKFFRRVNAKRRLKYEK